MREVLQELRAVEEALDAFDAEAVLQYPGLRLMRSSLEQRRQELLTVIHGQLDMALTRSNGEGTGAELSLVSGVLSSFQESVASIAQTYAGKPTARGLIPGAIKEQAELRIAAAAQGSLRLRLIPAYPLQEPLFDDGPESLLEVSIGRLLGLLQSVHGDRGDLLQDIADLGPRVTTHVQTFARHLADGHASVSLRWGARGNVRSAKLDRFEAATLREVLREVEEETHTLVFTGRVVGGSLVRRTFELETDAGTPDTSVIAGRVAEEALAPLEALFGQRVTAHIEVRQSRLKSGETRESHVLLHLAAF